MTTPCTPRWRLKPVAVGGAHLARPVAWGVVGLLVLVTLVALFAKTLAPYDPIQPVGALNLPPLSPGHLLGTDGIGRDLLSRTLIGIQVSWLSALVVVASGLLIGGTVGLIAGATGGWVDSLVLMRITDLFLALPGALVAIAIVAALGSGLTNTLDRRRPGVVAVLRPHRARRGQGTGRPAARRGRPAGQGRPDPHPHPAPAARRRPDGGRSPPASTSATSCCCSRRCRSSASASRRPHRNSAPTPPARCRQLLSQWWVPGIPGLAVLLLTLIANLGGDAIRSLIPVRR